jgi:hypothetical protein
VFYSLAWEGNGEKSEESLAGKGDWGRYMDVGHDTD